MHLKQAAAQSLDLKHTGVLPNDGKPPLARNMITEHIIIIIIIIIIL
jgi:hypothetical protein